MKKLKIVAVMLIVITLFVGCSNDAEVNKNADESLNTSFSAEKTENSSSKIVTENESNTENSTTQTTTAQTTTKPTEKNNTTTKKTFTNTTTKKQTQKQTTRRKQSESTTKKQITTKKVTTTEFEWDCSIDGHTSETGPIGWVNSETEATDKALEYIANHDASGNFRVEQCYMCDKFTAYITLD